MKAKQDSRRGAWWAVVLLAAALVGPVALLRGADDEPPIVRYMTVINDGYKVLRKEARGKTFNDQSVATVIGMQMGALQAMHEAPPMLKTVPTGEQKQFIINYRKEMRNVLNTLIDLEIAMLEGRADDAATIIDSLAKIKKDGHDKFMEE